MWKNQYYTYICILSKISRRPILQISISSNKFKIRRRPKLAWGWAWCRVVCTPWCRSSPWSPGGAAPAGTPRSPPTPPSTIGLKQAQHKRVKKGKNVFVSVSQWAQSISAWKVWKLIMFEINLIILTDVLYEYILNEEQ